MSLPSDFDNKGLRRRKLSNVFKALKKIKYEPRILCSKKTDFSGKKDTNLSMSRNSENTVSMSPS